MRRGAGRFHGKSTDDMTPAELSDMTTFWLATHAWQAGALSVEDLEVVYDRPELAEQMSEYVGWLHGEAVAS